MLFNVKYHVHVHFCIMKWNRLRKEEDIIGHLYDTSLTDCV